MLLRALRRRSHKMASVDVDCASDACTKHVPKAAPPTGTETCAGTRRPPCITAQALLTHECSRGGTMFKNNGYSTLQHIPPQLQRIPPPTAAHPTPTTPKQAVWRENTIWRHSHDHTTLGCSESPSQISTRRRTFDQRWLVDKPNGNSACTKTCMLGPQRAPPPPHHHTQPDCATPPLHHHR